MTRWTSRPTVAAVPRPGKPFPANAARLTLRVSPAAICTLGPPADVSAQGQQTIGLATMTGASSDRSLVGPEPLKATPSPSGP